MKASDLRIGNLLYNDGVAVTIDARSIFDIWNDQGLKKYSPIPLTTEWLERLGFTPDSHKLLYNHPSPEVPEDEHKDLGKNFPAFFFNKRPEVNSWMDCHTRVTVAYVHQLQNLYHALTGEELTLNGKG